MLRTDLIDLIVHFVEHDKYKTESNARHSCNCRTNPEPNGSRSFSW